MPINPTMRAVPPAALRRSTVLGALAACLLASPAQSTAGVEVVAAERLEKALVTRVNNVRASRNLRALAVRFRLKRAGRAHATNMARYGYFSHSWSTGVPFETWIRRYWPGPGYTSWSAGENLFWRSGGATAREIVRAWMTSPPHRANLLGRRWRALGIGAVRAVDPVGVYRGPPSVTIVAAEFGWRR
jgi:uncharacterized protein YkwD